ncbi:Kynureninase (L-kynurenine hydrolase) [Steccherinum ochraceum]|uniref:Kynureninase n=1 Tax=Steccherinum ochraceum TaxID=92696 RepID=A0A4R0RMC5_9APHY|nr:Kynureninase (L-kynurenine hydrolase) [Steccherinum ochraceum]
MTEAQSFKLSSENDELSRFRDEFLLPTNRTMKATKISEDQQDNACAYLAGNSLGLMAKRSRTLVEEEMSVWATRAVEGHFDHPFGREWVTTADAAHPIFAELVGAKESEVACMGTLTANLHLLLNTFYKPTQERYKILCEVKAFPSDQYAFASQVAAHGYTPSDAIIELSPRPGEYTLRDEDILDTIAKEGGSIAIVLFSGVQYYTGQHFSMQQITKAAKEKGCICGWDLAHAIGNVPVSLHDWDVDFAVWCTYKYVNSGPGGIAGLFVHEKWDGQPIRHAGWWGHDLSTRFAMPPQFNAIPGAQGFQQSNPSVLAVVSLLGSLEVFREAGGIKALRERSLKLTGYLEAKLHQSAYWIPPSEAPKADKANFGFTIITPSDPSARGSQLSLLFQPSDGTVMPKVLAGLAARGVVGDSRKPDVIRLAPTALYNNWDDIDRAASALEEVLAEIR